MADTPQEARAPAPPSADDLRAQLRQTRLEARLAEEQLRLAQASRRRRLTEGLDWTTGQPGWSSLVVGPEAPRADQTPPATRGLNKGGKNFPLVLTEQQLAGLRGQARVLAQINPYARGLVEGLTSYVIGPGYTYRASARPEIQDVPEDLVRACQTVLDEFAERTRWFGGEEPGLEEDCFARSVVDGEFFLALFDVDGRADVRVVEPEQVTTPPGADFAEYGFGVRTPSDDVQQVLAYNVCWDDGEHEEFPADQVVHYRRNARRGQKRGIPDLAYGPFECLNLGALLVANLGETAAEQATIVGVRQHTGADQSSISAFVDGQTDDRRPNPDGTVDRFARYRAGRWEDMGENSSYVPGPINQNGSTHLSILQAVLRAAGTAWNAPEWLVSGDASNNNYASSLTAESPFVRTVVRRQRGYRQAFRQAYLFALRCAADAGRIVAAGRVWGWAELSALVDVLVESVSPETRNRLQEAQQAAIEIPLGVDSRQRYAQSQGRDWAQVEQDNDEYLASTGGGGAPLPLPGDDEGAPQ